MSVSAHLPGVSEPYYMNILQLDMKIYVESLPMSLLGLFFDNVSLCRSLIFATGRAEVVSAVFTWPRQASNSSYRHENS